jgi:hypothetical protein
MFTETMIAFAARLWRTVVAMINYEVNASLAAFAPTERFIRIPKENLHDSHARTSDLQFRLSAIALRNRR